jgi:putative radical SAM enzyme (TIGR03279 family)
MAKGIKILEVEAGSPAESIGLKPGDRILTVNGHTIADELALKFYLSEGRIDLCVLRPVNDERHFKMDLFDNPDPGIRVEEFRTRLCNNACIFCFVDQLPPEVRSSLKVKDDDYRLSFLHGNYITLTNLNDVDLSRIIEQRLSPLYVSVHATDSDLRARILGRKKRDDLAGKMRKLVQGGIRLHAQIVLMPGINDGKQLQKTVFDLYNLYPGVQSIAIVPVGISDYGSGKTRFMPVTPEYSRALIHQALAWQAQFRTQINQTYVCLADEFYLQGGLKIPNQDYYDDFAQIEDGVGMVRYFLDEFKKELSRRRKFRSNLHGTIATGKLFYPVLKLCVERFNRKFGANLQVCEIENRFMGSAITVAGLLGGRDFVETLAGKDIGDFLIIPGEALARGDGILIDDWSPKDISRHLKKPVYPGGHTVRDFFDILSSIPNNDRNKNIEACRQEG